MLRLKNYTPKSRPIYRRLNDFAKAKALPYTINLLTALPYSRYSSKLVDRLILICEEGVV